MRVIIDGTFYDVIGDFDKLEPEELEVGKAITINMSEYENQEAVYITLPIVSLDINVPSVVKNGNFTYVNLPSKSEHSKYLLDNCRVDDPNSIINLLKTGAYEVKSVEDKDLVVEVGELFLPPISSSDNLLSRAAKEVLRAAKISIKSISNKFQSPSDMNNYKRSLMTHPTMSWDKFTFWMDALEKDIEIRIVDRETGEVEKEYRV